MPIQFQCPACRQPIEVDEEWRGKEVTCPYCHKVVTAPEQSTYSPPAEPPVARPAMESTATMSAGAQPMPPAIMAPAVMRQPPRNAVAIWALVLSLSALACLITTLIIMGMHVGELEPLMKMQQEGKTYQEINQAMLAHFQNSFPSWMVAMSLTMFLALGTWVAGVVCGVIGLFSRPRKNLAVTALVISGSIMMLLGLFAG